MQIHTATRLLTLFPVFLVVLTWVSSLHSRETATPQPNNADIVECDIFLAPTPLGWGVFAGRDFQANEVVEYLPLFVPVLAKENGQPIPAILNTVLDDYVYGYDRHGQYYSSFLMGMGMMYNHHPQPNVKYEMVERMKQDGQTVPSKLGFSARRAIRKGEELFSTYGEDDGGELWFQQRGIPLEASPQVTVLSQASLGAFQRECCSRMTTSDGLGYARAKVALRSGDRIEVGTGLVMTKSIVSGTILAPLVIAWEDFNSDQQDSLRILQESGQLKLQYQSDRTKWERINILQDLDEIVVLPSGGAIGTVRRVRGTDVSNCKLLLPWQGTQRESVGVVLELVATKPIMSGEILKLDLPPGGTESELTLLKGELDLTDQHYFDGVFSSFPGQDITSDGL